MSRRANPAIIHVTNHRVGAALRVVLVTGEVLLTGFEPFGGHEHNISEQIATHLADSVHTVDLGEAFKPYAAEVRVSEVCFTTQTLSVDEVGSRTIAESLNDAAEFEAIIHLGFDENAERLRIESRGVNENDFRIPDNSGRQTQGETIHEGAPSFLPTTAPYNLLLSEFEGEPLLHGSDDAGRYLCNETYFRTLAEVERLGLKDSFGRSLPVLFIHIPSRDWVPIDEQIRIVVKAAAVMVQRPRMSVVGGLLRDTENRLLAARRAADEYMAGFWEFPGGKVEAGESEQDTREGKELLPSHSRS